MERIPGPPGSRRPLGMLPVPLWPSHSPKPQGRGRDTIPHFLFTKDSLNWKFSLSLNLHTATNTHRAPAPGHRDLFLAHRRTPDLPCPLLTAAPGARACMPTSHSRGSGDPEPGDLLSRESSTPPHSRVQAWAGR